MVWLLALQGRPWSWHIEARSAGGRLGFALLLKRASGSVETLHRWSDSWARDLFTE